MPAKPPLWRDVRILRIVFQAAVVAVVVAFGLWLYGNVRQNAAETNVPLSYDYLDQPAGFPIPDWVKRRSCARRTTTT